MSGDPTIVTIAEQEVLTSSTEAVEQVLVSDTQELIVSTPPSEITIREQVVQERVLPSEESVERQILTSGEQGPRGIQGPVGAPGSSSIDLTATAGETLSGHRVVFIDGGYAYYADVSSALVLGRRLALTLNAALLNEQVTCRFLGEVNDVSFSFPPGPLYITGLGVLTSTPPVLGAFIEAGYATGTGKIVLEFSNSIVIEG